MTSNERRLPKGWVSVAIRSARRTGSASEGTSIIQSPHEPAATAQFECP